MAIQAQQTQLEGVPGEVGDLAQILAGLALTVEDAGIILALLQAGDLHHAVREQLFVAHVAQVVEDGDQHDGNVFLPGLDVLQVVRQLDEGPYHQPRRLLALTALTGRQGPHHLQALAGQHDRALQLGHLQGAQHVLDEGQRGTQMGHRVGVVGVGQHCLARLLQ